MRYFLIIFYTILFHSACTDECKNENVFLGNIEYDQSTIDHIHYEAGQIIQFQNEDGSIKQFEVTEEETGQAILCVTVTCRPSFELDGENGCKYYNVPSNYFVLKSSDVWLHFKSGLELYEAETEMYYEFVEIGLASEDQEVFAGTISAQNFTPRIESEANTILSNFLSFESSDNPGIDPSPSSYSKKLAYSNSDGSLHIALQKEQGIIQFVLNGELWTLVQ